MHDVGRKLGVPKVRCSSAWLRRRAAPSWMLHTPPDLPTMGSTSDTLMAVAPTARTSTVTPLTDATSASQPKYLHDTPALASGRSCRESSVSGEARSRWGAGALQGTEGDDKADLRASSSAYASSGCTSPSMTLSGTKPGPCSVIHMQTLRFSIRVMSQLGASEADTAVVACNTAEETLLHLGKSSHFEQHAPS